MREKVVAGGIALAALVLGVCLAAAAPAATLRVPSEYATIQEALDAAEAGDTVLVAPGEYVIRRPLNFNRLRHPADPQRPPRDLALVSEAGAERTVIRMSETPEDPREASVVVFERGETRASRLEGFTLAGGRGWAGRAGGVLCIRSAPTVSGCRISGNHAAGAAVFAARAAPRIEDSKIAGNSAGPWIGHSMVVVSGRYAGDDIAEIVNCTFIENTGGSVIYASATELRLKRSTLARNSTRGVIEAGGSSVEISSTIVWGNSGPALQGHDSLRVEHSLIEGGWPGPGNINADPLFCGWGSKALVHLDAAAAEEGDGSAERPFRSLARALEYSFALAPDSPCRGAGKDGEDMGADHGTCGERGAPERLVQAAPGSYSSRGIPRLPQRASLAGAGADRTVILGTVRWLRGGASLSGATVTGGEDGGIILEDGGKVEIADAWVQGNRGSGIACRSGSLVLRRSEVRGNDGTGIVVAGGRAVVSDSVIAENRLCGIHAGGSPEVRITRSTLAFNDVLTGCESQLALGASTRATVVSSIIRGDPAFRSIVLRDGATAAVTYSDVAGGWPGEGNIEAAPLFCGWAGGLEMHVDPASPPGGDGSAARPYARLAQALAWSFGLAEASPCRGAGEGGADMGADRGSCGEPVAGIRTVRLAAGHHLLEGRPLLHGASLLGSGAERTVVEGTLRGLVNGSELGDLTLTGGPGSVLVIDENASPAIRRSAVRGVRSAWPHQIVSCRPGSAPLFEECAFVENDVQFGSVINCDEGSRPELIDCRIERNRGTGLYAFRASPRLLRVTISDNSGTGIRLFGGTPLLAGCRITGNPGGGIVCHDGSAPFIEDSVFAGNVSGDFGAAILSTRSSPTLRRSTVAANVSGRGGGAIFCVESSPLITHSILWGNPGGSIELADEASRPQVSYSLLEEPWPGKGNLDGDPRFCGYLGGEEAQVDPSAASRGDGSAAAPFRELREALDYSFALALDSPCRGAGEGGSDLGADLGACEEPGTGRRTVHLAPGVYRLPAVNLALRASLAGAGAAATVLEGCAAGLREGERLSGLTITLGEPAGVVVAAGEAPLLEELVIERNLGQGVICAPGSVPRIRRSRIVRNRENGVVCGEGASPTIADSVLAGHSGYHVRHGQYSGGNLYAGALSSPRVVRCDLTGAQVSGIFAESGARVLVERSRITGNRQGGVRLNQASACLSDSLIAGNLEGAVRGGNSSLELLGVTVASNRSFGEATIFGTGELVVENSIIWGNTSGEDGSAIRWTGDFSPASPSIIEDEDPLFANPGKWDDGGTPDASYDDLFLGGDFRLLSGSPAIDRGDLALVRSAADLDGAPRVCGKSVDLGAYEAPAGECREAPEAPGGCLELPPLAAAFTLAPESGLEPLEIAVDASSSTTAGLEAEYRWYFGDGSSAAGERASHTYRRPGRFTLRLIARDQHFRRAEARREVTVILRPEDIAPWTSRVLGEPPAAGPDGARRDGPCLLVAAAGSPLASGQGTERLRFVHRELEGDFALTARIDLEAAGSGPFQTGLMLRESADPEARFGALVLERTPGAADLRLVRFHRGAPGEPIESSALGNVASAGELRLRLSRRGAAFLAAVSAGGAAWQERGGALALELPPRVLAGLAAAGEAPALGVCPRIEGLDGASLFRRGDTTADGFIDLSDAIALLGHLFLGAPGELPCRRSADADDSGRLEITDAIHILGFLFLGGRPPPAPFPGCGFDSTHDTLDCSRYPPCD